MTDRAANLLGVLAMAATERIEEAARSVLHHVGETPAALVIIGYGSGPSNNDLGRILHLSHPGTVRLVDRLVADGLVVRERGNDKRSVALHLTEEGQSRRAALLQERISVVRPLTDGLSDSEIEVFESLLGKILASLAPSDLEKRRLCRMCQKSVCTNCPIPADI